MNRKLSAIILMIFSFLCVFLQKNNSYADSYQSSTSEIVMELNSNRVLYEHNIHSKKFMASTTKILTALVVINNMNMSDIITVTSKTIGVEGSSIYLEEGEKLTVKELLYGLMLRSGNDCAETLAVSCAGSIEAFAKLMNECARDIGAKNSNFVNPHGLHDDNHYTTAYDLALISCEAMKNDTFREIVGTKSVDISFSTRDYNRHLVNKNKMLKEFEGSTGIKTGFTKKAGRCLVSSCYRDGMELICVVLNSPQMFSRSKELLSGSFDKYNNYFLVESDNIIGFTSDNSRENIPLYIKNDIYLPLTEAEYKSLRIVYDYPDKLDKELKSDDCVGFIRFFIENNLIFSEKIYTII